MIDGDRVRYQAESGCWWHGSIVGSTRHLQSVVFDHIPQAIFGIEARFLVAESVEIEEVPF